MSTWRWRKRTHALFFTQMLNFFVFFVFLWLLPTWASRFEQQTKLCRSLFRRLRERFKAHTDGKIRRLWNLTFYPLYWKPTGYVNICALSPQLVKGIVCSIAVSDPYTEFSVYISGMFPNKHHFTVEGFAVSLCRETLACPSKRCSIHSQTTFATKKLKGDPNKVWHLEHQKEVLYWCIFKPIRGKCLLSNTQREFIFYWFRNSEGLWIRLKSSALRLKYSVEAFVNLLLPLNGENNLEGHWSVLYLLKEIVRSSDAHLPVMCVLNFHNGSMQRLLCWSCYACQLFHLQDMSLFSSPETFYHLKVAVITKIDHMSVFLQSSCLQLIWRHQPFKFLPNIQRMSPWHLGIFMEGILWLKDYRNK